MIYVAKYGGSAVLWFPESHYAAWPGVAAISDSLGAAVKMCPPGEKMTILDKQLVTQKRNKMFLPRSHVLIQYCGEPP